MAPTRKRPQEVRSPLKGRPRKHPSETGLVCSRDRFPEIDAEYSSQLPGFVEQPHTSTTYETDATFSAELSLRKEPPLPETTCAPEPTATCAGLSDELSALLSLSQEVVTGVPEDCQWEGVSTAREPVHAVNSVPVVPEVDQSGNNANDVDACVAEPSVRLMLNGKCSGTDNFINESISCESSALKVPQIVEELEELGAGQENGTLPESRREHPQLPTQIATPPIVEFDGPDNIEEVDMEISEGGEEELPDGAHSPLTTEETNSIEPTHSSASNDSKSQSSQVPENENEPVVVKTEPRKKSPPPIARRPDPYVQIGENEYKVAFRQDKSIPTRCVCTSGPCLDGCLNHLSHVECGIAKKKTCGSLDCQNNQFQMKRYAKAEVFDAGVKGHGLRAVEMIPRNTFIMEYVGEVVDDEEVAHRLEQYSKKGVKHHYMMQCAAGLTIDATIMGNETRFINHSCDPNAFCQKWLVSRRPRIGFFSRRTINPGDEIVFDYQFSNWGKAQLCRCGAANCTRKIGAEAEVVARPDDDPAEDSDGEEEYFSATFSTETLVSVFKKLKSNQLLTKRRVRNAAQLLVKVDNNLLTLQRELVEWLASWQNAKTEHLFMKYGGLTTLRTYLLLLVGDEVKGTFRQRLELVGSTLKLIDKLPISTTRFVNDADLLPILVATENFSLPDEAIAEEVLESLLNSLPGESILNLEPLEGLTKALTTRARVLRTKFAQLGLRIPRKDPSAIARANEVAERLSSGRDVSKRKRESHHSRDDEEPTNSVDHRKRFWYGRQWTFDNDRNRGFRDRLRRCVRSNSRFSSTPQRRDAPRLPPPALCPSILPFHSGGSPVAPLPSMSFPAYSTTPEFGYGFLPPVAFMPPPMPSTNSQDSSNDISAPSSDITEPPKRRIYEMLPQSPFTNQTKAKSALIQKELAMETMRYYYSKFLKACEEMEMSHCEALQEIMNRVRASDPQYNRKEDTRNAEGVPVSVLDSFPNSKEPCPPRPPANEEPIVLNDVPPECKTTPAFASTVPPVAVLLNPRLSTPATSASTLASKEYVNESPVPEKSEPKKREIVRWVAVPPLEPVSVEKRGQTQVEEPPINHLNGERRRTDWEADPRTDNMMVADMDVESEEEEEKTETEERVKKVAREEREPEWTVTMNTIESEMEPVSRRQWKTVNMDNNTYYYHKITRDTVWKLPEGEEADPPDAQINELARLYNTNPATGCCVSSYSCPTGAGGTASSIASEKAAARNPEPGSWVEKLREAFLNLHNGPSS